MCRTTVKASAVVNDVANHPGRGRAANDQEDIVVPGSDIIPEDPQFLDEVGILIVEAGNLIDENHAAFLAFILCDDGPEGFECLVPVLGFRTIVAVLVESA